MNSRNNFPSTHFYIHRDARQQVPAGQNITRNSGVSFRFPGERWYPRQESNLYLEFRKPSFYPLNYGDGGTPACSTGLPPYQLPFAN